MAWAHGIARRALTRLPASVDLDDVYGPALVGLWRAAMSYQPSYQRPGYAHPVPFRAWARRRIWGACMESCRRRSWRDLTHEALADEMGARADAERDALRGQVETLLRRALVIMTPQQQLLMTFCHLCGLSVREASSRLGVNQSRGSQVHTAALLRMRVWLERRGVRGIEDCL